MFRILFKYCYRMCEYQCSEYDVFKFIIYASIHEQLEYLACSDKLLLFRVQVFIILIMLFHIFSLFSLCSLLSLNFNLNPPYNSNSYFIPYYTLIPYFTLYNLNTISITIISIRPLLQFNIFRVTTPVLVIKYYIENVYSIKIHLILKYKRYLD